MTNEELIKELRYCADYGSYKKGCSKCPINANGMVCGTHEDAIAKAADALEAAEKRIADQQKQIAKLDILLNNKIEELEAQFLKEGEWKWNSLLNEYEWVDKTFYCPNCGAKMKGESDGET